MSVSLCVPLRPCSLSVCPHHSAPLSWQSVFLSVYRLLVYPSLCLFPDLSVCLSTSMSVGLSVSLLPLSLCCLAVPRLLPTTPATTLAPRRFGPTTLFRPAPTTLAPTVVLYTSAKEYVPVSVCLFLFTYVCRSVCLSVYSSISICLPVSLCVYMSFVCPSFCMSVPLCLLLVPLRLCTDEHVIVAIFRLNTSAEKQHIYSQRCNCSDCVLCPVITERI